MRSQENHRGLNSRTPLEGDVTSYLKDGQVKALPYVTFALLQYCPFHCVYCGDGGETTISKATHIPINSLKRIVEIARLHGVHKFRFTGGEPMVYKELVAAIDFVTSSGSYLMINSNGMLAGDRLPQIAQLRHLENLHIAVSFDSPHEHVFDIISATKGRFARVVKNINLLKEHGLLMRINMVVTKHNSAHIFDMIRFCNDLDVDLKLQEVTSVPSPFSNWKSIHYPLSEIEGELHKAASGVFMHEYSRSHGIPLKVFKINNSFVTLKSLHQGSRYNHQGICNNCRYFPCHEGLYDVQVLPDLRIASCRWNAIGAGDIETFEEEFVRALEIFRNSAHANHHAGIGLMEPLEVSERFGLGLDTV